jgi:hypothetical protein
MKYYLQYRTGPKPENIDSGFLEAPDEHSAKAWFVKNKPAGYKLRVVRLLAYSFKIVSGDSTKNLSDLKIKFKKDYEKDGEKIEEKA